MKRLFTLFITAVMAMLTFANPRTMEEAMQIAGRFAADNQPSVSSAQRIRRALTASQPAQPMQLAYTQTQTDNATPALYVFNTTADDGGFVIVSADDRTRAILGYTDNGYFDANNMPDNLRFWLRMYASEIASLSGTPADNSGTEANETTDTTYPTVVPLLGQTVWGQGTPFNNLCPTKDGERCVTGCVATAASQIMYYHKYPTHGQDSYSYEWNNQTLSADFANTTYDWANMIPDYSGNYTTRQANAVATLMSHVGISCNMNYDISANGGSGANSNVMMQSLINHFGYDAGIRVLPKDYMDETEMLSVIAQDLQANHPIFMEGCTPNNEGHAFVLDGMQSNGYVHINWGWNGYYDAYFPISAMNPYGQGTGGSASGLGFTEQVTAFTGIQPNQGNAAIPLIIADDITLNSQARLGKYDDVAFNIYSFKNAGVTEMEGTVVYIIYKDDSYYTAVNTYSTFDLPPGYYYPDASTVQQSLSSLSTGNYELSIGILPTNSNTMYPIRTASARGERRFPLTVTSDSVFIDTTIEGQYTIRLTKAADCDMNITNGLWIWWWADDNAGQCVPTTLSADGWYTATIASTASTINCLTVNQDVAAAGWSDAQQTANYTDITGDMCLEIGGTDMYRYNIYATDCSTPPIAATPNMNFGSGEIRAYGVNNREIHLFSSDDPTTNTVAARLQLDLYCAAPYSVVGSYLFDANSTYAIGTMSPTYSKLYYTSKGQTIEESITDGATTVWLDENGNYQIAYTIVANSIRYTDTVSISAAQMSIDGVQMNNTTVTALTVAQALDMTNALSSNEISLIPYFVRGDVTTISEISTDYGNARFYIKDKDVENSLYAYRLRWLNNTKFTTGQELAAGDDVVLLARLQNYRGTMPELYYGYVYKKEVASNYVPTNLQVSVANYVQTTFSWDVVEGDVFELKYTRNNSDYEETTTVYGTSTAMTFQTADTYHWWVRARTLSGKVLSDWVQGNDFIIQDNLYQPYNLTATSTDGYHYTFSWQADRTAASYTLVISYSNGDNYYHTSTDAYLYRDVTLALNGDYTWCVIANLQDDTEIAQTCADGTITVTSAPSSVISNLQISKTGLSATITWEGDAPYYYVKIYDNNENTLESSTQVNKSYTYTASELGTYWVWIRPANEELTYYIGSAVQESFVFTNDNSEYTPYNLQATTNYGTITMSWQVQQGNYFRIILTKEDGSDYSFTSYNTTLTLNVSGFNNSRLSWKVCTLDDEGNMLSDYVQGPDMIVQANPYEPQNLQADSDDGYTYTFTWTADQASPLYYIVITNTNTGNTVHTHVVSQMSDSYTFRESGYYNWTVYACTADTTFQGYKEGTMVSVYDTPDFSISNLSVSAQGLFATATWGSAAPQYEVVLYDNNWTALYTTTAVTHTWQYTVPYAGGYYVAVTPIDTDGNSLTDGTTYYFTAVDAESKDITVRSYIPAGSGMDTSNGMYCFWWTDQSYGCTQAQQQADGWWTTTLTIYSNSVQCLLVDRNPLTDKREWNGCQQTYDSPSFSEDACLVVGDYDGYKWNYGVAPCDAYTAKYLPYDLQVNVSITGAVFTWQSEVEGYYEVRLQQTDGDDYGTYYVEVGKSLSLIFNGARNYRWYVRTLTTDYVPVSDFVEGTPFEVQENPYQPRNLQVSTQDSITYYFTWDADQEAPLYSLRVCTWAGDTYYHYLVKSKPVSIKFERPGEYYWQVYARMADTTAVSFANGGYFDVPEKQQYIIENLSVITTGTKAVASWSCTASAYEVRLYDTNDSYLSGELTTNTYYEITNLAEGYYTLRVTPVNQGQTYYYYLGETVSSIFYISATPVTPTRYSLWIETTAGGSVNSEVNGTYDEGSLVTITATPDEGYRFTAWSDGNTSATRTIVIKENTTLIAYFEAITTYTVTVNTADGGTTNIQGTQSYVEGTELALYATPDATHDFDYWLVNSTQYTANPLLLTVTQPLTITPVFKQKEGPVLNYTIQNLAVTVDNYKATATWTSAAQKFHITITDKLDNVLVDTVISSPETTKQFIYDAGKAGTFTISVRPMDYTESYYLAEAATKTFTLVKTFSLYIEAGNGGTVNAEVNGKYPIGTEVEIIATPDAGYEFSMWDDGDKHATRTVFIDQNYYLTAIFRRVTSVDNVAADMSVRVIGYSIEVSMTTNQTVSLLDATGKLIATESDTRSARFFVPQAGIYILRSTNCTTKVMVP